MGNIWLTTTNPYRDIEKEIFNTMDKNYRLYGEHMRYDILSTMKIAPLVPDFKKMIKDVIFNDPATIVLWNDGTKTVVKAQEGCEFDPWVGMAMAFSKKMLGNKGNYFEIFKKYCEPYEEKMEKEKENDYLTMEEYIHRAKEAFADFAEKIGSYAKETYDIVFTTREDAEDVLEELKQIIRFYGCANLKDLAELTELDDDRYDDNTTGWVSLEKATVRRTKYGWTIDFPKPMDLGVSRVYVEETPKTDSSDDTMTLEEYKAMQRAMDDDLNKSLHNPVTEAYILISNFLNGKGSLDLDEIRGLLGEALE